MPHACSATTTSLCSSMAAQADRPRATGAPFRPEASAADAELALASAATLITEAALEEVSPYIDLGQQLADTVPDERRLRFDFHLATIRLALARRRADLDVVQEAMVSMEAALAAPPRRSAISATPYGPSRCRNLGSRSCGRSRLGRGAPRPRAGARAWRAAQDGRPYRSSSLGRLGHRLPVAAVLASAPPGVPLRLSEEAVRDRRGARLDGTHPVLAPARGRGGRRRSRWLARVDDVGAVARRGARRDHRRPGRSSPRSRAARPLTPRASSALARAGPGLVEALDDAPREAPAPRVARPFSQPRTPSPWLPGRGSSRSQAARRRPRLRARAALAAARRRRARPRSGMRLARRRPLRSPTADAAPGGSRRSRP